MKQAAVFLMASVAAAQPRFGDFTEEMREVQREIDMMERQMDQEFSAFERPHIPQDVRRDMMAPFAHARMKDMAPPMPHLPRSSMMLRGAPPMPRLTGPFFQTADAPVFQAQGIFDGVGAQFVVFEEAPMVETFEAHKEQIYVNGVPEVETHKVHCKGSDCTETLVVEGPQNVASVEGPMPVPASLRGAAEKLAAQKGMPCDHMKMSAMHGRPAAPVMTAHGRPAAPAMAADGKTNLVQQPMSQWNASGMAIASLAALALVPVAALGLASRKCMRRSVAELEEPLAPQRNIMQEVMVPDESQLVGKYVQRLYERASN